MIYSCKRARRRLRPRWQSRQKRPIAASHRPSPILTIGGGEKLQEPPFFLKNIPGNRVGRPVHGNDD